MNGRLLIAYMRFDGDYFWLIPVIFIFYSPKQSLLIPFKCYIYEVAIATMVSQGNSVSRYYY